MLRSPLLKTACALWVGTCSLSAAAATAAVSNAGSLSELTYAGTQQALEALDRELQIAGKDAARIAALEKRLLTEFARRDATFAARQAVAQRLGTVLATQSAPSPESLKVIGGMLVDERDSDLARLALERVTGSAVDALFVQALPNVSGRLRLGLINAIAARRIQSAVAPLTPLLQDPDLTQARAAARALGEIGTSAAVAALRAAPIELTAAARLAAATRLPVADATQLLRELENDARAPAAVRHAAFRTSLNLAPGSASTRIAEALKGNDWPRKQVALESLAASPAPNLVPTLTANLPSWDAPTQVAVIAALGRRAEAAAVPAVLNAVKHPNTEVRSAALAALGFLPGSPETAAILAGIAADPASDEARTARQSLTVLNGPGVSAAILSGAEKSSAALRPVYLEQLALRNLTEGLPILRQARNDANAAVRIAAVGALGALGDLAPIAEQAFLLDWTLTAKDEAEQARALRSLVNVTLRNPDVATRGQPVFQAIDQSPPDVALRLLPALSRMGGAASADTAARLAIRDDAKLADLATAALARWADGTALPALATVAEKAALPSVRESARSGALSYFERNREPWTPETTDVVRRLLATSSEAGSRKQLIAVLHRANEAKALKLAEGFKSDSALATAANTAAEVIRANLAGAPTLRASGGGSSLKNILDFKTSTRWNVPTAGEEWIEIDFRRSRPLTRLTLDQTTRNAEYPEKYEVYVTDNVKSPGNVVASGSGQRNKTIIDLPENTRGRYVIIKNVAERKESNWSIVELYVD